MSMTFYIKFKHNKLVDVITNWLVPVTFYEITLISKLKGRYGHDHASMAGIFSWNTEKANLERFYLT